MSESFTPKQVARAIGVSESSLKRWCDRGLIPTVVTAGGHRRLPVQGVLDFIEKTQRALVHPEAIGLPSPRSGKHQSLPESADELTRRLTKGDEAGARRLLLDLFLNQQRMSVLGDQVVQPALERIGQLWECGDFEIYRERLSCRICLRVLDEVRRLLPHPPASAPLAIGASLSGDWYELPGVLVDLVVRQNGWRSLYLGNNLPVDTLLQAIEKHRPKLVWLSVSHIPARAEFVDSLSQLSAGLKKSITLVIGGRALVPELLAALPPVNYCRNLAALEVMLQQLRPVEK